MNKRISGALAVMAVLALSAGPAFAGSSTGIAADVTAHIKGQDLALYSISIQAGGTLTYNQLDGVTVEVGKKGETLGADADLLVWNNGTEAVDVAIGHGQYEAAPQLYNGESPVPGASFSLAGSSERDTGATGFWEFAKSVNEPAVPQYLPVSSNGSSQSFGMLAAGDTQAYMSRLTLPGQLPVDAPGVYFWQGTVLATPSGI